MRNFYFKKLQVVWFSFDFLHIQVKDLCFSCSQHHRSESPPKRVVSQKFNTWPKYQRIKSFLVLSVVIRLFSAKGVRISTSMSLRNKSKTH